jgi:acetyl-CoA synthetase
MYEGAPDTPHKGRFWEIIDKWGVTIFYTAPTAIRAFMRWGDQFPRGYRMDTLRLLGTVGEPINPAAWMWYHEHIGAAAAHRRYVVADRDRRHDGVPAARRHRNQARLLYPAAARHRGRGHPQRRHPLRPGEGGYLGGHHSWPASYAPCGAIRSATARPTLAIKLPVDGRSVYFTGDGARFDEDGYLWVMGRVDDVLNVAGHRIGTAEVESALVGHPHVAEAAVVGRPDELKGQAIVAFVTLRSGHARPLTPPTSQRARRPRDRSHRPPRRHPLHRRAAQDSIRQDHAPLLREIATTGKAVGDVTTLEDLAVLTRLAATDSDEE